MSPVDLPILLIVLSCVAIFLSVRPPAVETARRAELYRRIWEKHLRDDA